MLKTALYVEDDQGRERITIQPDTLWESSSTIKVAIVFFVLQTMQERHTQLDDTMQRLPHHSSKGSGILNWTNQQTLSFYELISVTLRYSDCLATNMLLDYVGGRDKLNQWLLSKGFSTQLQMPYLYFTDEELQMPLVGRTTARDLLGIYRQLVQAPWPDDIRSVLFYATSHVHQSWFEASLTANITDCHHKTGSMIDSGRDGETVYNAVGDFMHQGQKYYFCFLNHGWLDKKAAEPAALMKQEIAAYFKTALLDLGA